MQCCSTTFHFRFRSRSNSHKSAIFRSCIGSHDESESKSLSDPYSWYWFVYVFVYPTNFSADRDRMMMRLSIRCAFGTTSAWLTSPSRWQEQPSMNVAVAFWQTKRDVPPSPVRCLFAFFGSSILLLRRFLAYYLIAFFNFTWYYEAVLRWVPDFMSSTIDIKLVGDGSPLKLVFCESQPSLFGWILIIFAH